MSNFNIISKDLFLLNLKNYFLIDFQTVTTYINAQTIYIFLLYVFIPLVLIIIGLSVFTLIFKRYSVDKDDMTKEKMEDIINIFLTDLIFSDYTKSEITNRIHYFKYDNKLNSSLQKHILEKLLHIKRNLNSTNNDKIISIYEGFGFEKISEKLIKKRAWHKKTEAFYHYQNFNYLLKIEDIKKYIDSKNPTLRSNAIISLLLLSKDNIDLLEKYNFELSRADEFKILEVFSNHETAIPENIDFWLQSQNSTLVIFAIKLLVLHKNVLSKEQINLLLNSPNKLIRREVILAIRNQIIFEANKTLMSHYDKETYNRNKISIVKTFEVIGNQETVDFLFSKIDKEDDKDVKLEIVKFIYKIDSKIFNQFILENEEDQTSLQQMINHAKEPLLN